MAERALRADPNVTGGRHGCTMPRVVVVGERRQVVDRRARMLSI